MNSHLISILGLSATIFISGCATCQKATFNKPSVLTTTNDIKVELSQLTANLTLADKVKVTVRSCSKAGEQNFKLCASIEAPTSAHIRIDNDDVTVTTETASHPISYKLGPIVYEYVCLTEIKDKRVCSSSEDSPTGKPITVISDREEYVYALNGALMEWHSRSFPVTQEFVGALDTALTAVLRTVSPISYRTYNLTLIDTVMLSTPVILRLPKLWVNGNEYILPEFRFATVTEEFCYHQDLM